MPNLPEKPRRDWQDDAACVGMNLDSFFSEGLPSRRVRETCESCPVITDCLAASIPLEAAQSGSGARFYGFRGGLTAGARQQLAVRLGYVVR